MKTGDFPSRWTAETMPEGFRRIARVDTEGRLVLRTSGPWIRPVEALRQIKSAIALSDEQAWQLCKLRVASFRLILAADTVTGLRSKASERVMTEGGREVMLPVIWDWIEFPRLSDVFWLTGDLSLKMSGRDFDRWTVIYSGIHVLQRSVTNMLSSMDPHQHSATAERPEQCTDVAPDVTVQPQRNAGHVPRPTRSQWDAWKADFMKANPVLPNVDKVIWPAAKAALPGVTQSMVRDAFGGKKPGPRVPQNS